MFKSIPYLFIKPFDNWYKIELFRRALYIFLFLNTLSLLPVAEEIWGYNGVSGARGWDFSIPTYQQGSFAIINFLSHPINNSQTWIFVVFIVGQLTFLITGFLRFLPKLSSIMVYFFTVNLFLKGHLMFTGGEVLLNLILFYIMFIQNNNSPKFKFNWRINSNEITQFSFFQNLLNNTFFYMILIQVCTVYFFSSIYKLMDENWLSGEALMYISSIDVFSSGMNRFLFAENPNIALIFTYFSLAYQCLFPILVWVKKIKGFYLLIGILMHLGIAFGMGLFSFGIIMCLVYIPFLSTNQLSGIMLKFKRQEKKTTI